jgi:hypothetical protein
MGYNTGDRILETTATSGTGNITLGGAVTGYRAFSSVITANDDQFPYVIAGGTEWEVGIGTRLNATTFSRVPTASSNAGALVNFSAGTKEVWIDWTDKHVKSLTAKNIVINGGMEVDQEHAAAAQTGVVATRYAVDMVVYQVSSTAVVTLQQVADAPTGLKNSLKLTVTTADASIAAGDYAILSFFIEGYRSARLLWSGASAQALSLGFFVKAHRTGSYSGSIENSANNRSYPFNIVVNVADTWECKMIVIPGDTTGAWLTTNGIGMRINFAIMAGSSLTATANSWTAAHIVGVTGTINGVAATTDTFQITGVVALPGVVPVTEDQAPHAIRPFDEELALCQRYYWKTYVYTVVPGTVTPSGKEIDSVSASNTARPTDSTISHPVRMRATPTMIFYSPDTGTAARIRNDNTASDVTLGGISVDERVYSLVFTSQTSGHGITWQAVGDARL